MKSGILKRLATYLAHTWSPGLRWGKDPRGLPYVGAKGTECPLHRYTWAWKSQGNDPTSLSLTDPQKTLGKIVEILRSVGKESQGIGVLCHPHLTRACMDLAICAQHCGPVFQ